jgi:hypothetical protein
MGQMSLCRVLFLLRKNGRFGRLSDAFTEAANIAIDAFTTLTLAGLASIDPLALSQWMKDEAEKSS